MSYNNFDGVGKSMMFEGKTDEEKEALYQKHVDHLKSIRFKKKYPRGAMVVIEDIDTIIEEWSQLD